MRSGQVYQPTTTGLPYDRSKSWLSHLVIENERRHTLSKRLFLFLAALFACVGIILITIGATTFRDKKDNVPMSGSSASYITFLCFGVVFEIAAIFAILFYCRTIGLYDPWFGGFCCPDKISRIRKNLHERRIGKGQFNGQPISAQYCPPAPPSVDSSPPPPFTDISEQQMLMGERQDAGSDESERILEEDPRIVLTPLKNHEEC